MGFALLFTVDIDRLLVFYKNPWGIVIISFFGIVSPLLILFGFSFEVLADEVVSRSYFFFIKRFEIGHLSYVLYQPTWRGLMPNNSHTNMRSLQIVRHSGGWMDTISLSNGAFKEKDLADIAKRLQQMNPKIQLDEHATVLIKKYERRF